MVVCPVCKKKNDNNHKYCSDCGTKLIDVEKDSIFEFDENRDISEINELNNYLKQLNEKINQQKKFLDDLNNDPLVKKYTTISSINNENNELRVEIKELKQENKKISSDLKQQKIETSKLRAEINELKNKGVVTGIINGIFGKK